MTRQYKSTDEELRETQVQLESMIESNEKEVEDLKAKKQLIEDEKMKVQTEKMDEMKELTLYIETMHNNFASMLKKTLEKMKDRIARANAAWEEEQDDKLMQKFKDIISDGGQ